ncbi:flagellin [Sagittula sp. NFXS13]|uniref:Flagellin n=1 Tax=Sagittula marina TaxID=943940 RepID=A0A7W6GS76_9RHOB|nr:flagellin [Sagittula marina]MBB3985655.1 flagellin [Sagittula marina]
MSSILTNPGATSALQTLKMVNRDLGSTQNMISTGKKVDNAKSNAAVWAISTAMESDVAGFKKISESLSLGQATIDVARKGAETVTDLLTQVKEKVVAAQEENVDRAKIQTDIVALRDQVSAVVNASQFNGQYMLDHTSSTDNSGSINVLASIDRASNGIVTSTDINVSKEDLGTGTSAAGTVSVDRGTAGSVAAGATATVVTFANNTSGDDTGAIGAGQTYQFTTGGASGLTADVAYVAREGDDLGDITAGLVIKLNKQASEDGLTISFSQGTTAGTIDMTNDGTAAIAVVAGDFQQSALDSTENNGTIGGRLEELANLDVTTQSGADSALAVIDGLIDIAIDSAAAFGSSQMRIESQSDFVSGLTDALKSGIGTLVDADMEETSAKLQALQVQQQLAVQALSIANQAPQSLLSLFR